MIIVCLRALRHFLGPASAKDKTKKKGPRSVGRHTTIPAHPRVFLFELRNGNNLSRGIYGTLRPQALKPPLFWTYTTLSVTISKEAYIYIASGNSQIHSARCFLLRSEARRSVLKMDLLHNSGFRGGAKTGWCRKT